MTSKNNPNPTRIRTTLKKHGWKFLLALTIAVLLLSGWQWLSYERNPLPQALDALKSDSLVTVTQEAWLTFTPLNNQTKTGFIFYPGGRISYLGYADSMRRIAEQGFLVVVPKMPFNIAAANPNAADQIIRAHPDIQHWVISGHSVGGTMAAQYTKTHSNQIAGLVIWASFPADSADLSDLTIPMALIYGSRDPAANEEQVQPRRRLFPETTNFVRIDGGDHHQFGSYEIKPEDHHATIGRTDQQDQIIQATLAVLNQAAQP